MQQHPYKNFHRVPAAAFFCVDARFFFQTVAFLKEELGFEYFDPYTKPSGPRVLVSEETRNSFLNDIERVSIRLHEIKEIVLIAHRDCGAYGGSVKFPNPAIEKATQVEDLKIARGVLLERFPGVTVNMFYAEITGEFVEFFPVPVN